MGGVKRNKIEKKKNRELQREERGYDQEFLFECVRESSFRLDQNIYTSDCFDTPCIMSYQTGRRWPLASVSSGLLMMGGWIINAKPASLYLVYRVRHINLFHRTCIYYPADVLRRRLVHMRSISYPNFTMSCSAHLVSTEMESPWSPRSIVSVFNFHLLYKFSRDLSVHSEFW